MWSVLTFDASMMRWAEVRLCQPVPRDAFAWIWRVHASHAFIWFLKLYRCPWLFSFVAFLPHAVQSVTKVSSLHLLLVDDNVSCAEDSDIPRAEKESYLVAP